MNKKYYDPESQPWYKVTWIFIAVLICYVVATDDQVALDAPKVAVKAQTVQAAK